MGTIIKAPMEYRYPRTVKGREVWDQQEPPPEMVWAVCPYTKPSHEKCKHCTQEIDPIYGTFTHGCYMFAAEACRVVFAMQNRKK